MGMFGSCPRALLKRLAELADENDRRILQELAQRSRD